MQGNATRSHAKVPGTLLQDSKVPGTLLQDSASGAWYLAAGLVPCCRLGTLLQACTSGVWHLAMCYPYRVAGDPFIPAGRSRHWAHGTWRHFPGGMAVLGAWQLAACWAHGTWRHGLAPGGMAENWCRFVCRVPSEKKRVSR